MKEINTFDENGNAHSIDGKPAMVRSNGTKVWYQHGARHRDDGPAFEFADGTLMYFANDRIHRDDGPAVISNNGTLEWYHDGIPHRVGGPALIYSIEGHRDIIHEYWFNGELHNNSGPAVLWRSGFAEYWFNGIERTEDVLKWANSLGIELNNMSEDDKLTFTLTFGAT